MLGRLAEDWGNFTRFSKFCHVIVLIQANLGESPRAQTHLQLRSLQEFLVNHVIAICRYTIDQCIPSAYEAWSSWKKTSTVPGAIRGFPWGSMGDWLQSQMPWGMQVQDPLWKISESKSNNMTLLMTCHRSFRCSLKWTLSKVSVEDLKTDMFHCFTSLFLAPERSESGPSQDPWGTGAESCFVQAVAGQTFGDWVVKMSRLHHLSLASIIFQFLPDFTGNLYYRYDIVT